MDNENPHRRSRPRGVMVCEILYFVGPNHPTDRNFKTVSLATWMTETIDFAAGDSGKMAWYQFRWINSRGEKGPLSPIYNALITQCCRSANKLAVAPDRPNSCDSACRSQPVNFAAPVSSTKRKH